MGLLDSVMGALGGQPQGGEGLLGMLGNQPQLLQVASSLLGNDGGHGGLQGLIAKFQQAGLGDLAASWVGIGANLPITGLQLSSIIGSDTLSGLVGKFGGSSDELAGQLSSLLPALVDKFTPDGQVPAAGLGNGSDLMGMLGSLLKG